MPRLAASFLLLAAVATLHAEQPLPKAPDGFKVELVLQAPDIEAPTALAVAPNGDVYFAEDPMDMAGPPTKPLDRIWMLSGGDPKKKALIADKMWAVMGLEMVRDKLYVVHAPHVTVFTLGSDGKPTKREELFDDLGPKVAGLPGFNDHIPSGIRMGMDGWLYVSIGDKGIPKMSRIPVPLRGTAKGKAMEKLGSVHVAEGRWRHTKEGHHISLEGGGVIRFRPDGTGLEVFASGTRNHLDVPLDEHDRIFVRDNTDDGLGWNTRLMYLPPGAFMGYPCAYKWRPLETLPAIHDFGGGSPCGGWVYCDDGLPEKYRGRIFHCEWGQGKVWAVRVQPDGAGFKYVDQVALLDPTATGVKDFRPFTLRPTADGRGFYVTDWGYSGWLAKVKAGRLWKVTYTKGDVKPALRGKDSDSVEQLIKALGHPAHSERLRAQRELAARGKDVTGALVRLLEGDRASARARRHALWVLRAISKRKWVAAARTALKSPHPSVRLEAARVLQSFNPQEHAADQKTESSLAKELLRPILDEADAQVRMHKILATCDLQRESDFGFGKRAVATALVGLLGREADPTIRFITIQAVKQSKYSREVKEDFGMVELDDKFFRELITWHNLDKQAFLEGFVKWLTEEYDLDSVRTLIRLLHFKNASIRAEAAKALSRVYFDRKPYAGTWWGTQPAAQKPPARVVPWEGTPMVRDALLKALGDKDADVRKDAVAGLLAARDPDTLDPLVKRFGEEKDAATRADLVRAVAGLDSPKAVKFLAGVLDDDKNPEALRIEVVAGLERFHRPSVVDSLSVALAPREPVALRLRVLEALGNLKAKEARQPVTAQLKSKEPAVRRAAAAALGKIGDTAAAPSLMVLLTDGDTGVQAAAVQALGSLKLGERERKEAVAALLPLAGREATQFDALTALTKMPDVRAVPAYLTGLASKNADLRKACRAAFAELGDKAVPTLEQLAKRNEIPAGVLPELREVYSSFVPVLSWRLIGPFERNGKPHPPETEQKLDAVYPGADRKDVKWRTAKGDAKQHGRVNLAALFSPNQQVEAYAYAEVESASARDATLVLGSDDTITVWLNGNKVHEFTGDRGWSHNQDRVNVKLAKSKNRLLIKCGNSGGPWEFSVAVSAEADRYTFLKGGPKKFDLEAFRAFARKNRGDPERGRKLFLDVKGLACVKCHAIGGQGGQVGPDLAGISLKYQREELMTSVLEPSKTIAQGYETIILATAQGKTITGVFKGESGDAVNLADADGNLLSIPKKDIEERAFSPVSVMPNGLSDGMTLQDFADLIAFLEARREDKGPPKK